MKRTRYTKYNGDLASEMNLDDLMEALSDFLLDSGFQDPFSQFQELNGEHTLENLREALRQLMESGDFLNEADQQRYEDMDDDGREQMLNDLVERMQQGDYIQQQPGEVGEPQQGGRTPPGEIVQPAPPQGEPRFNVTDKSMDFLSYKSLRDLLGGMGRAMSGRHDTRYEASGIESSGSSKPYEFGDVMNLDVNTTLSSAIGRAGPRPWPAPGRRWSSSSGPSHPATSTARRAPTSSATCGARSCATTPSRSATRRSRT